MKYKPFLLVLCLALASCAQDGVSSEESVDIVEYSLAYQLPINPVTFDSFGILMSSSGVVRFSWSSTLPEERTGTGEYSYRIDGDSRKSLMHLIDVGPETEVAPYVLADGEFRMKQSGITYVHDDPEVFLTWEIVSGS